MWCRTDTDGGGSLGPLSRGEAVQTWLGPRLGRRPTPCHGEVSRLLSDGRYTHDQYQSPMAMFYTAKRVSLKNVRSLSIN